MKIQQSSDSFANHKVQVWNQEPDLTQWQSLIKDMLSLIQDVQPLIQEMMSSAQKER